MKDSKYHNSLFYEKYILGKLSSNEEDLFEEHLLMCSFCQKELKIAEEIVMESKSFEPGPIQNISTKKSYPKIILAVAASIAIIISIRLVLISQKNKNEIVQKPVVTDTLEKKNITGKEIIAEENIPKQTTKQKEKYKNPENYKLLPAFENAIENTTRSEAIKILSPRQSGSYHVGDTLLFNWESNEQNLSLVIFSNKGDVIFENVVELPYYLTEKLNKGLYYWQIENEIESLYTGKFLVK